MNLGNLENSLKLRLIYPYIWGRKQNNDWDLKTQFIYNCRSFGKLQNCLEGLDNDIKNYALNRWYNFWSAMGVEQIFCEHENITANKDSRDGLVDFNIDDIGFDHKTTVFPKGFSYDVQYAKSHKQELIEWLYQNQSQQSRKHMQNRIFIVLFDGEDNQHWKLKSDITLLRKHINKYMKSFDKNDLVKLYFGKGEIVSDIIWVCK